MEWRHSRIISTAVGEVAAVAEGDDGWEALPFGFDGGSRGSFATRDEAIQAVESILGDVICCVGHLAEDSDR
ncbi:MAG: hypothetical protein ACFCUO_10565 [Rhodospirillales bacterium]